LFHTVLGNIPENVAEQLRNATSDTAKAMVYNQFAREILFGENPNYYQIQQFVMQGGMRNYSLALQYALQGLALAEQAQWDKGRAELHRTIGSTYNYLNDFPKAIEHYEAALALSEKLKDMNGMALNYYNISLIYNRQNTKIYYSLNFLQQALLIWRQLDNIGYLTRAYNSIIRMYIDIGEFDLARAYVEEALNLALRTGNRNEEAVLNEHLAHINRDSGNAREMAEYYQKTLKIYEELGDMLRVARVTQAIASDVHSDNPETAIGLLQKSAAIFEMLSPTDIRLFQVYNSLGDMFLKINYADSAEYYKEIALNKALLSENQSTIATAYDEIGKFYLSKGDANRAKIKFQNAYDIASEGGFFNIQSNALSGLSDAYYQTGDYQIAFNFKQLYRNIRDSLTVEENIRNVRQLTMQYEFRRDMQHESETIKAQLERQQQANRYQLIIVGIVSGALLISAFLLVFLIRSNKIKKEHYAKILRFTDELEESHHELSQYKDNLEEMVKEQTAKLQQSEAQLRTLSDNLPGGCIYRKLTTCDGKEIVTYVSNTAEKFLGLSAGTIMDDINSYYRQMLPEDIERKKNFEQESLSSMLPHSFEYRLMKGDQEVWLLENSIPHVENDQNIVWDGIIVDISDRKKFEKEIIEAKERAEESDTLKSSFLANMSHEIRTPINGIVGFLNILEREDLPADRRYAYAGIIRSNVQQLMQLIGDIVDLSKLDTRQMALHNLPFDMNAMMNELEIFFQDFILKREKKLELILDSSGFISPCIIESDHVRVRQVLSNLIGNAIKFTEMGYIRFGYRLTENGDKLYIFVEDTGIGISKSKQEYIFERFRQAHDEKTQIIYGGTGLGLAISKNLLEMMGGEIGVESEEGFGSTFYFTLPYS